MHDAALGPIVAAESGSSGAQVTLADNWFFRAVVWEGLADRME